MATTRIPIVFIGGSDPVGLGLVRSLAHPGGNITGTADLDVELAPKRMEIFRALVPSLKRILVPYDATNGYTVSIVHSTAPAASGSAPAPTSTDVPAPTVVTTVAPIDGKPLHTTLNEDVENAADGLTEDGADRIGIFPQPVAGKRRLNRLDHARRWRVGVLVGVQLDEAPFPRLLARRVRRHGTDRWTEVVEHRCGQWSVVSGQWSVVSKF